FDIMGTNPGPHVAAFKHYKYRLPAGNRQRRHTRYTGPRLRRLARCKCPASSIGKSGRRPARPLRVRGLFAGRAAGLHLPDLCHDLVKIVAGWVLHRREVDVGLKLLQPQRLADGQKIPVVNVGSGSSSESAGVAEERLLLLSNRRFEWIARNVDDLGPGVR